MTPINYEKNLHALCALSNSPDPLPSLLKSIYEAPDPETATRGVLSCLRTPSDLLEQKIRQTIWRMWSDRHPRVPLIPSLPLTSHDVVAVPIVADANAYLAAIARQPAQVLPHHQERLLSPADVYRLYRALPSHDRNKVLPVESEWSYPRLRRLRATLMALKLLRVVQGTVTVVQSRYEKWQTFPATQQFYSLWHAEVYHSEWREFGGIWEDFLHIIQDHVGLLWEYTHPQTHGASWLPVEDWYDGLLEDFLPLWNDAGLLESGAGHNSWIRVMRQQSVLVGIHHVIMRDLFHRHGLIEFEENTHNSARFRWTPIGTTLLEAERTQKLPCAVEMLR